MNEAAPQWLPLLMELADCGGDWRTYVDSVYAAFNSDFIRSQAQFRGRWVRCRRDPMIDGKEWAFWHCVSEGSNEADRIPDLRRCERIRWIRALIENADQPEVDV